MKTCQNCEIEQWQCELWRDVFTVAVLADKYCKGCVQYCRDQRCVGCSPPKEEFTQEYWTELFMSNKIGVKVNGNVVKELKNCKQWVSKVKALKDKNGS